ncbi:NADAR family protein [Citrifermentans bremense]|uniref:hypothetical protein n=1 Tax=Citrifermentans bremense TaxID=60035 RepID=UPI000478EDE1|nr:hypothetical protein [Citrifermentans bremense]
MDVGGYTTGIAGRLSNFIPRVFVLDGFQCACLEGALQAFKFDDPEMQKRICMMSGKEAKTIGQTRNEAWQSSQTLWWQGRSYDRLSPEYQQLLDRLYEAALLSADFADDLLATGEEVLTHSIGEHDPRKTVLTEEEFCSRLMANRSKAKKARET